MSEIHTPPVWPISPDAPFVYPDINLFNANQRYLWLTNHFSMHGGLPKDHLEPLFYCMLNDPKQKIKSLISHFFFREAYEFQTFWTHDRISHLIERAPNQTIQDGFRFFRHFSGISVDAKHLELYFQVQHKQALHEAQLASKSKTTNARYDFTSIERTTFVWEHSAVPFLDKNSLLNIAHNELSIALCLPGRYPFALDGMIQRFDADRLWTPSIISLFQKARETQPHALAHSLFLFSEQAPPWMFEDLWLAVQSYESIKPFFNRKFFSSVPETAEDRYFNLSPHMHLTEESSLRFFTDLAQSSLPTKVKQHLQQFVEQRLLAIDMTPPIDFNTTRKKHAL